MKFCFCYLTHSWEIVTSYAEVWIEICKKRRGNSGELVTSYAEVWIEIGIHYRQTRR